MTHKALLFAYEYAKDLDMKRALSSAGYASSADPLAQEEVGELVAKLLRQRMARLEITGDWVMTQLKEIVLLAKEDGKLGQAIDALKTLGAMVKDAEQPKQPKNQTGMPILFGSAPAELPERSA